MAGKPPPSSLPEVRAVLLARVGRLFLVVMSHHLGATLDDPFAQMVGVVAFVGDGGFSFSRQALDQIMSESDVVALSGRAYQAHWIAQRIPCGVEFRAQPCA